MANVAISYLVSEYVRLSASDPPAYTLEEADACDRMHRERMSVLQARVGKPALVKLGATVLELLVWMTTERPNLDRTLSELTVDGVRAALMAQLSQMMEFLRRISCQSGIELNAMPLDILNAALRDLENGVNSRLLVTGALTERVLCGQYSHRGRIMIQGRAAAAVEHLLRSGQEKSQIAAARRVARALKSGGYASTGSRRESVSADTVKRWHNAALPNADETEFGLGSTFDLFMHVDATSFRRKAGLDPTSILEDLANMCRTYRMPG